MTEQRKNQGRVIWITGLSGAGKTTLARALQEKLPHSILLDGDEMREALIDLAGGFDRESRRRLAFTYARWANLLAKQGSTVIVATISLYHDLHAWNREHLPGYLEVFLDVPEEIRRKRDPKGLYHQNVPQMVGSDNADIRPLSSDITLTYPFELEEGMQSILMKISQGKKENGLQL